LKGPFLKSSKPRQNAKSTGKVETTALRFYEAAGDIKPKNISIDTLSRDPAPSPAKEREISHTRLVQVVMENVVSNEPVLDIPTKMKCGRCRLNQNIGAFAKQSWPGDGRAVRRGCVVARHSASPTWNNAPAATPTPCGGAGLVIPTRIKLWMWRRGKGFEPSIRSPAYRTEVRCLKPLSHPSGKPVHWPLIPSWRRLSQPFRRERY
jgi:hypothetical protein